MGFRSRRRRRKGASATEAAPAQGPSEDARAAIAAPLIAECIQRLCKVAGTMIVGMPLGHDDSFPLMAGCFIEKQVAHARGAIKLGDHPDALLIARSMLEGVWQLTWAAQSRVERAEMWLSYAHIHDWRVLNRRRATGAAIGDDRRSTVEEQVKLHGRRFRLKKPRLLRHPDGALFSDPYRSTWHGLRVIDLARAANDEDEYERGYHLCSQRHHWDPADSARMHVWEAKGVRYIERSPLTHASALLLVFMYLYRMADLVNTALDRHAGPQLDAIMQRYADTPKTAG